MGDETRRAIVRLINDEDSVAVDELPDRVGASAVAIRHVHLPVLEGEHIVTEVDGVVSTGEWFNAALSLVDAGTD